MTAFFNCSSKKITDVSYLKSLEVSTDNPKLNVFVPRKSIVDKVPVLVFIHGGN